MIHPIELSAALRKLVFSVTFTGHKSYPANFSRAFAHPFYTIHYIIKGEAVYIMNGSRYTVEPGKIAVFTPTTHFEWSTETGLEVLYIRFDCRELSKQKQQWTGGPEIEPLFPMFGVYSLLSPEPVYKLFLDMHERYGKEDALSEYEQSIVFQMMWLAVVKDFQAQSISGDSALSVQSTIQHMHEHYREPLSIQLLAGMAGLHPSHYCRKFKQLTGLNPKKYLIMYRINLAKEQLADTDSEQSLKSIASRVGYDDELYFSRLFKQVTGCSPRFYSTLGESGPNHGSVN
jgi:AraC-like DNA-binding protein